MASDLEEHFDFKAEQYSLYEPFPSEEADGVEDIQIDAEIQQPGEQGEQGEQGDLVLPNVERFDLNNPPPSPQVEFNHTQQQPNHHQPRLNNQMRQQIMLHLISKTISGTLPHGEINKTSLKFGYSRRTIGSLWNRAKKQMTARQPYNLDNKYHMCGRKRVTVPYNNITSIHMGDRTCIRDLASKLDLASSTVWRMIKRGSLKPHTNAMHPEISDENKLVRLDCVLSLLQHETLSTIPTYYTMYDFVHIDEKWLYLSKKSQKVYLVKGEPKPYRCGKSSKFIPKVMFMGCVARPRWNEDGQCIFNGKIGIFPFTEQVAARRSLKKRQKGTIETKPIESVNKTATRDMLINHILPAIKAKWPDEGHKVIYIQQDNAKAHITQDDPEWQAHYQQDDFTFILVQQPPNSPDCNILDLGFFRSIQSLMHKKMPRTIEQLVEVVEEAYNELHPKTLSIVWMSLQYVLNEILKAKGSNYYDVPHHKKRQLEDDGLLSEQVIAPKWAVKECMKLVHGEEYANEIFGIDG